MSYVERVAKLIYVTWWTLAILTITHLGLMLLERGTILPARDDTDAVTMRSGMALVTDYRTGCQYLSTKLGGVTPRLDTDGRVMCAKAGR